MSTGSTHSTNTGSQMVTSAEGSKDEGQKSLEEEKGNENEGNKEEVKINTNHDLAPKKVSDQYNEEDADVTIITSDGVTFKVHSYLLKSASTTFRSMLSLATNDSQRDPIVLTHEVIERAEVLTTLLDILNDCEVESFNDMYLIGYTIDLAEKWDFVQAIKIIRQSLRFNVTFDIQLAQTVCLIHCAIKLRDFDVLGAIIKERGNSRWASPDGPLIPDTQHPADDDVSFPIYRGLTKPDPGDAKNSRSLKTWVFKPGSMSRFDYFLIPPMVHWAIARATCLVELETGQRDNWSKVSDEFKRLMNDAYPPTTESKNRRKREEDKEEDA